MTEEKKRSFLVPTLFTIFVFSLTASLGTWQLFRLQEKNQLIAELKSAIEAPAVSLSGLNLNHPKVPYRHVRVTGNFMNNQEVHLFTGPREPGGRPGYHIMTPFKLASGGYIMVDRGWTPSDIKAPQLRLDSIIWEPVTIEGLLMPGEHPGYFTARNQLDKNVWFWLNTPEMEKFTGFKLPLTYVRQISAIKSIKSIIPNEAKIRVRNDHLQYAITWYALAIASLVIYVLLRRSYKRES